MLHNMYATPEMAGPYIYLPYQGVLERNTVLVRTPSQCPHMRDQGNVGQDTSLFQEKENWKAENLAVYDASLKCR